MNLTGPYLPLVHYHSPGRPQRVPVTARRGNYLDSKPTTPGG